MVVPYSEVENEMQGQALSPYPHSALIGEIIVEPSGLGILPPRFRFMIPLAEDSSPSHLKTGEPVLCITTVSAEGRMLNENQMGAVSDLVDPVCLALTLMHCKNVSLDDNIPPEGLNKKHLKRATRKIPLVTYKTIVIEPAKSVLKKEGGIEEQGLAKALHICRGHFKKFNENPLFGKVRGTFWWPAHARGAPEAGLAIRDYKIKMPG